MTLPSTGPKRIRRWLNPSRTASLPQAACCLPPRRMRERIMLFRQDAVSRPYAGSQAAARDWSGAKALFRLEASLLGAATFAAGAVPRLLPLLLGLLGLAAVIHVFTTARTRLLDYAREPVFVALLVFLAYVFINATWSPDPGEGMAKAATTLGLSAAV